MKLIAQKPCSFGGKKFYIGDEIPAELVQNPKAMEKMGRIAIVNSEAETLTVSEAETTHLEAIQVEIHAKEGDMPLEITKEGLQAVVDVLTGTPKDAEAIIAQMTDGDALILLHITDTRKAVKAAAEDRAKALNAEESAGEQ
jgi:hypothetical protein